MFLITVDILFIKLSIFQAERTRIDVEEAKLQARERKEAIERAKKLQYYETDRVKGFHVSYIKNYYVFKLEII